MIVAADTRLLTNHGYLKTRNHHLTPLALPESKGTKNNQVFCKSVGDRQLIEYKTDLGHSLVCDARWEVGSYLNIGVSIEPLFGSFGNLSTTYDGLIIGLLVDGAISLKEHFAFINAGDKFDEVSNFVEKVILDFRKEYNRASIEQYIQNEYIGGSMLFDAIAVLERDPESIKYAVPDVIWEGNYYIVRDYLSALVIPDYIGYINHNYVRIMSLKNNLFARQVQMLLQNFNIVTKIVNEKDIALNMFEFNKFVDKIGIYRYSHSVIDQVYSLYDRAVAESTPSFATIVSAKPYEKVACSQIYSDEYIIANGIVINPNK